jgi:predicted helicase
MTDTNTTTAAPPLIGLTLSNNNEPVGVKAEPRPHQVQADLKATFAEHDRGTVVMASGTGKTLVALWATEQAAPKTVLVLVPSLTLLQQTLLQWCKHRNKPFQYIAVCSDPTVVE